MDGFRTFHSDEAHAAGSLPLAAFIRDLEWRRGSIPLALSSDRKFKTFMVMRELESGTA